MAQDSASLKVHARSQNATVTGPVPVEAIVARLPAAVKLGLNIHNFANPASSVPVFLVGVFSAFMAFILRRERKYSRTNDLLFITAACYALAVTFDLIHMAASRDHRGHQIVVLNIFGAVAASTSTLMLMCWIWWMATGDFRSHTTTSADQATVESGHNPLQREVTHKNSLSSCDRLAAGSVEDTKDIYSPGCSTEARLVPMLHAGGYPRQLSSESSVPIKAIRSAFWMSFNIGKGCKDAPRSFFLRLQSPRARTTIVVLIISAALTELLWKILILFTRSAAVAPYCLYTSTGLRMTVYTILTIMAAARLHDGRALSTTGAAEAMRSNNQVNLSSGVVKLEKHAQDALIVLICANVLGIVIACLSEVYLGFISAPLGRLLFCMEMLAYHFTAYRTAQITSEFCSRPKQVRLRPLGHFRQPFVNVQPGVQVQQHTVVSDPPTPRPAAAKKRHVPSSDDEPTQRRLSTIVSADGHSQTAHSSHPPSPTMGELRSPSTRLRALWVAGRDARLTKLRRSSLGGHLHRVDDKNTRDKFTIAPSVKTLRRSSLPITTSSGSEAGFEDEVPGARKSQDTLQSHRAEDEGRDEVWIRVSKSLPASPSFKLARDKRAPAAH